MVKLFNADYDGTLRVNQKIAQSDLDAIRRFMDIGNRFNIVTGRSIGMIEYEIKHFNIPLDFLIANNGGIAITKNKDILFRHDIDFEVARTFIGDITSSPFVMLGCSDGDKFATIQEGEIKETPSNFNVILGSKDTGINKILANQQINSFFLRDSTLEKTISLYSDISIRYHGKLDFHFNNGTIDVSSFGVSKKNAIEELSLICGISEIYVIGDGFNDIDMIKAYNGFTVVNAADEVKQHATKIFGSVRECIEDLIK